MASNDDDVITYAGVRLYHLVPWRVQFLYSARRLVSIFPGHLGSGCITYNHHTHAAVVGDVPDFVFAREVRHPVIPLIRVRLHSVAIVETVKTLACIFLCKHGCCSDAVVECVIQYVYLKTKGRGSYQGHLVCKFASSGRHEGAQSQARGLELSYLCQRSCHSQ